jgi:hypothetical protein
LLALASTAGGVLSFLLMPRCDKRLHVAARCGTIWADLTEACVNR